MVQKTSPPSSEKIISFASLPSTNLKAKEILTGVTEQTLYEALDHAPFWIVADEQTAGRGRQGREWISTKGNLFATNVRRVKINGQALSTVSLIVGIAVFETLQEIANLKLNLILKWPNDILCENQKLGGILIEVQSNKELDHQDLIIGIGLNLISAPQLSERKTTCLKNFKIEIGRDEVLNKLIEHLNTWFLKWDNGFQNKLIIEQWLQRSHPIGGIVNVKRGKENISGTFLGLDEFGGLKIKSDDGITHVITGGELL